MASNNDLNWAAEKTAAVTALSAELQQVSLLGLRNERPTPYDDSMTGVPREELDAKLQAAKAEQRADGETLRADFEKLRGGFTAGFETLRADIHKNNSDQLKWIVGLMLTLGAVGISLTTFILNNNRGVQASPPQSPVNVYVAPSPQLVIPPSPSASSPIKP